jgi:membrane fusion protein (multidrug efflux system)
MSAANLFRFTAWRPSPRILLGAAALVLGLTFSFWLIDQTLHVRSDDARVRTDMVTVSAELSGLVAGRSVRAGDAVAQGAVLAWMDDREAKLLLASLSLRAEALEREAEGQFIRARMLDAAGESRIDARRSGAAADGARLAEAESSLAEAKAQHGRTLQLHQRGQVADAAMEMSAARVDLAAHAVRRVRREMEASVSGVHEARALSAETDIAARTADASTMEARALEKQIALQALQLARHTLTSPLAGVVDEVFVEPGEWVDAGQRIALLHDPSASWIEANIRESDIARVKIGAKAHVEFDAIPGRSFSGSVVGIRDAAAGELALLPVVNPTGVFTRVSQRVTVKIVLDGPAKPPLRPGALARVRIRAGGDGD